MSDVLDSLGGNAQAKLKSLFERANALLNDRDDVNADLREVYTEAKGEGFDTKILRKAVALSRRDRTTRDEEAALIDLYMGVLVG